jgi:hypothetical protein
MYQHGIFWDYGGLPKVSAVFWTLLAVLDPSAVILLFRRPNIGVVATAAIIVLDVIHNVWIVARFFPPWLQTLAGSPQVIAQMVFLMFVMATAPVAWSRGSQAKV